MIADILNGPSPVLCWPALPQCRAGWRRTARLNGRPDPTRSTDLGWLSFG